MFDILSITTVLKCALVFVTFLPKNAACYLYCFLYSEKNSSRKVGAYPTPQATFSPRIIYLVEDLLIQMPLTKKSKQNYDGFLRKSSEKQKPVNM